MSKSSKLKSYLWFNLFLCYLGDECVAGKQAGCICDGGGGVGFAASLPACEMDVGLKICICLRKP